MYLNFIVLKLNYWNYWNSSPSNLFPWFMVLEILVQWKHLFFFAINFIFIIITSTFPKHLPGETCCIDINKWLYTTVLYSVNITGDLKYRYTTLLRATSQPEQILKKMVWVTEIQALASVYQTWWAVENVFRMVTCKWQGSQRGHPLRTCVKVQVNRLSMSFGKYLCPLVWKMSYGQAAIVLHYNTEAIFKFAFLMHRFLHNIEFYFKNIASFIEMLYNVFELERVFQYSIYNNCRFFCKYLFLLVIISNDSKLFTGTV